jgi:hypothetical protein
MEALSGNKSPEGKTAVIEELKNLIEGEPQVFFILVGAMKFSDQKNRYESGSFSTTDENSKLSTGVALPTGGKDRMLAAAKLHLAFPQAFVVPMSRTRDDSKPTYAAMTQAELIHKGVKSEKILLEEVSVSTITEFKAVAKMCEESHWNKIAFITSNWHVPRSKALLNHIVNFADNDEESELLEAFREQIQSGYLKVQFVGSEEVLKIGTKHYDKLFGELVVDPFMEQRILQEKEALSQIANGEYAGRKLDPDKQIWPVDTPNNNH